MKACNKIIVNDSVDIWHLQNQHSQQEQILIKNQLLCHVCMCVLDLHSFIFRFSGGSEQDLCPEGKSKCNDFIIFY